MDAKQIIEDLKKLGIQDNDTILVHSSYNALKGNEEIEDGPQAVIDALMQTVSEGTLMLPTLSYIDVTVDHRYFDVNETPSCVGILPEIMRHNPSVYRSIHPTHSVAIWGKDAQMIAEQHLLDFSPVGVMSPFHELKRRHGKIVMLGCGLRCITAMHGVEEMVVPDYLYRGSFDYEIVLANGDCIKKDILRHDFKGYEQRYDRILDVLDESDYRVGHVLNATCYVLDADAVFKKALMKYREDPHYFVDEID